MTIATTITSVQFPRNGTTTQWPVNNKIFSAADVVVNDLDTSVPPIITPLVLGVDFAILNVDVDTGFTVSTAVPGVAGHTLDVRTNIAELQSTSIKNQGSFLPELHEEFFDKATRMLQDLLRKTYTFGMHGPDIEATPWPAFPIAALRRNTQPIFDANGLPALGTLTSSSLSLASITAFTGAQIAAEVTAGVNPVNLAYAPGHPFRYGAIDDGATNCNVALQNWIKVGQQGVPLQFPAIICGGGYLITVALSVTAPLNIQGGGWQRSALLCVGCDGFQIAAGVAQVIMQNFRMNLTVRYQTPGGVVTPNAFAGIRVLGSTGNQNTEHLYRDLFIDGFGTYIVGGGLQFSLIDNCQGYFGLQGIILTGLAADVTIRGGIYQCGNLTPSAGMLALQPSGVQIGGGGAGDASQGCEVLGATITGFFADVWLLGAAFCSVLDSQLDFANGYNVLSQSGVLASCCHNIGNNYMAITANGIHSVRLLNNVVTSFTGGSRVHGNVVIQYAAGASRGIRVDGTQEQSNIIIGNTVNVGSVADLDISTDVGTASHVVVGNNFQGLGANITVPCTYVGNKGAYVTAPTTFVLTPLYSAVQASLTYSASMTPDFKTNNSLLIVVTNATAFTIQNAINPPAAGGLKARIWILNASGGAIGAVTWGAAFKVPAGITYPANGFRRCYEFELAQAGGSYYLTNSPTVDIPN